VRLQIKSNYELRASITNMTALLQGALHNNCPRVHSLADDVARAETCWHSFASIESDDDVSGDNNMTAFVSYHLSL
jgi:hypothetical protein